MPTYSILILGNLLSESTGTRGIGEDIALRLEASGWNVMAASSHQDRLARLIDIIFVSSKYRQHYDVVYLEVYSGKAFILAEISRLLLKILGKPIVLILHGGNLPLFSQQWIGRVRRLLLSVDSVVTPSVYIKNAFVEIRDDILVIRNAIDLSAYPFRHRSQPLPRLAWLRAFHSIYNPTMAVQALSLLVDEFPDIELAMFGPDKRDGSLQTMRNWSNQAGITDHILIPGAIPKANVPNMLAPYDIFLNTTTAESFGVSVMEAAALGMCIVTTDVGELPYIWTHEHDALLVPSNDPKAMADAIRRILTEPNLAERLSRNARAKAEQFDWSTILPKWETLLTDVINRHEKG